jgi:hypothetical protein
LLFLFESLTSTIQADPKALIIKGDRGQTDARTDRQSKSENTVHDTFTISLISEEKEQEKEEEEEDREELEVELRKNKRN